MHSRVLISKRSRVASAVCRIVIVVQYIETMDTAMRNKNAALSSPCLKAVASRAESGDADGYWFWLRWIIVGPDGGDFCESCLSRL